MFFDADRIPAVREMIVSSTVEERKEALKKILPMQKKDFIGLYKAMKGQPVTIRFLDPPLHEFLPHTDDEIKALAKEMGLTFASLKRTVNSLHEFNPMMGHRGLRLAVTYPEIAEMQTRAVIEAALEVNKKYGYNIVPEIMIPLTCEVKEFEFVKQVVVNTANEIIAKKEGQTTISISFAGNQRYSPNSTAVIVTVSLIPTSIEANDSVTVNLTEQADLKYVFSNPGAGQLKFTFDDINIASIKNGKIIGEKVGKTILTIEFEGNYKYAPSNATMEVIVEDVVPIIEVDDSIEINLTEATDIPAKLNPKEAGKLRFISNDKDIVSISGNGMVYGIKLGTATVTVIFDGSGKYRAVNKTINVTVNDVITSIDVNDSIKVNLTETASIIASVNPSGAGKLIFTTNDNDIISINSKGVVKGLAEYVCPPKENVYLIPDSLSLKDAALTEPLSCCLHGVDLLEVKSGETVAVIGLGAIGALMVQILKSTGVGKIIAFDANEEKREVAKGLGVSLFVNPTKENYQELLEKENISSIDKVIECGGIPATASLALEVAGRGATVVLFGVSNPDAIIPLKWYDAFTKELVIKTSYINPNTTQRAISMLSNGVINADKAISAIIEMEEVVDEISTRTLSSKGKVIVRVNGDLKID